MISFQSETICIDSGHAQHSDFPDSGGIKGADYDPRDAMDREPAAGKKKKNRELQGGGRGGIKNAPTGVAPAPPPSRSSRRRSVFKAQLTEG